MAKSFSHRLPLLLAAGAVASAVAAAPALATEGPGAPPPGPSLPTTLAPATFAPITPFPSVTAPSAHRRSTRAIRGARLVHRRVRRGERPRLRVSLAAPTRLRIVMSRRAGSGRVRAAALSVPARGRHVSVRLPARSRGHALRPGRYRIRVVAIDAQGRRSASVRLTLIVKRGARH